VPNELNESSADCGNEPILLDDIVGMPPEIFEYVLVRHAQFEKRKSKMARLDYYMNTCLCGAHFGDFFLHHEPGGAFFPDTEKEEGLITIEELPFKGVFNFNCGYGIGSASFIFKYAKWVLKI